MVIKKEVYQGHIPTLDKTVIFEDVYEDEKLVSTTVKGFYYGEAKEADMNEFNGKLEATYKD